MRKGFQFLPAVGIAAAVFGGASAGQAATLVSSTFDTSADGWDIADIVAPPTGAAPTLGNPANYAVTFSSTGGDPGGFISETDPSTNDYYYSAPSKFLGDQLSAEIGAIKFNIKDAEPAGTTFLNTSVSPVILVGATESLYLPDLSTMSDTTFETLSYTLAPGNGFTVDAQGGAAATAADFTAVLGNLQAIYICGDYYNGSDTSSLDNVTLSSVPEPATVGLTAGFLATTLIRRRRRDASQN